MQQDRAPLFEALTAYANQVQAPLHVPGHKSGQGAPEALQQVLGAGLRLDQTEAPTLDDLHAPTGPILQAQTLAAQAWGAAHSFFLVGGTTAGLHALILATCRPGEHIAVPRHAHRSVLGALILSGAQPRWVKVGFHPELDIATHVDLASLNEAVHVAAAAVLVHPTYYGVASRLQDELKIIHAADIPALVDEAHGTHFAFHPGLPVSALSLGADAVVQSVHKTGGSLTQSSICHVGPTARVDLKRLREMLQLVQSTSPSYLLMASLDLARRDLALRGRQRWERAIELATDAARRLAALKGIRIHPTDDPTKLVIDLRGRQLTGLEAADLLWERGVAVESSGLGYVLGVFTPGDTKETVDHLVAAVDSLPTGPSSIHIPPLPPWPDVVLTPREAYLGAKESVPLAGAVGRIAAELVAPYPPGIPVVAPGERLTADVVDYLHHAAQAGYHLQGPADSGLTRIQVVKE